MGRNITFDSTTKSTSMIRIIITCVLLASLVMCKSPKASVDNATAVATTNMEEKTLGTISNELAEDGCDWIISVDDPEGKRKFQPLNLDTKFMSNGVKVLFTYTLSRAPSKCPGVQPVVIESMTKK
jgi:hypothetical protein